MRLFFGLCSTSARPNALSRGGLYMPNRPGNPLLEAVPPADWILRRPAPCLNGALSRRLLLVGAAQRHPVAVLLEHGLEVLDGAKLITELGLADDADDRRRVETLVLVHQVFRRPAGSRQLPRGLFCTGSLDALLGHSIFSLSIRN